MFSHLQGILLGWCAFGCLSVAFADFAVLCLFEEVEKRMRDCRVKREHSHSTSAFDVKRR